MKKKLKIGQKIRNLDFKGKLIFFGGLGIFCGFLVFVGILVFWPVFVKGEVKNREEQAPVVDFYEKEGEEEKVEIVEGKEEVMTEVTDTNPYNSTNCTTGFKELMLINPNFQVDLNFIEQRRGELIDITSTYGIREGAAWNGRPLLDAEAAGHLNEMLNAYKAEYSGHEITTRSCFRSRGTSCGRLCVATGGSDHHSGYTCDLIDDSYGNSLDTDLLAQHPEWIWLHQNSYKYGFIDRFVLEWAGGSMAEPANINAEGTTGLYETWHYRYVGVKAATEIASGKYNNGNYDSLEHYLKASGKVKNLVNMGESCRR